MLAAVLAALWFLPPIALLGVSAIVALLAFREYAEIADRSGVIISRPAAAMATVLVCIAVGVPGLPVESAIAGAVIALASVALGKSDAAAGRGALHTASVSLFAPLYLGLPLGLLAATRWTLGRDATLLLILTVAISDTLQFYSGKAFGRHLLAPVISPKKTIEGAVGGFAGGMLSLGILGHYWLPHQPLVWRLVLAVALVAVGIVGDLFESMLKRSVGVKDASQAIPGHGGVLDRIDALLFAAPVFYAFVRYRF